MLLHNTGAMRPTNNKTYGGDADGDPPADNAVVVAETPFPWLLLLILVLIAYQMGKKKK